MVRLIAYAIYVQNSIFLNFLKNEKIISSFLILSIFVVIVFFNNFVFRCLCRKISNPEKVINLQGKQISLCYLMMPTREFEMTHSLR